jgi:hypothetical protein
MSVMVRIGYWVNEQRPDLPDPSNFVDHDADPEVLRRVAWYLSTGMLLSVGFGLSPCRVCGKGNGSVEYTDGTYIWPEGLAHYVEDHQVRLPPEVEQHALSRLDSFEEMVVDTDDRWWRDQMEKLAASRR